MSEGEANCGAAPRSTISAYYAPSAAAVTAESSERCETPRYLRAENRPVTLVCTSVD